MLHLWLGEQRTRAEHQADRLGIHLTRNTVWEDFVTRVRADLFVSLDGCTSTTDITPESRWARTGGA